MLLYCITDSKQPEVINIWYQFWYKRKNILQNCSSHIHCILGKLELERTHDILSRKTKGLWATMFTWVNMTMLFFSIFFYHTFLRKFFLKMWPHYTSWGLDLNQLESTQAEHPSLSRQLNMTLLFSKIFPPFYQYVKPIVSPTYPKLQIQINTAYPRMLLHQYI